MCPALHQAECEAAQAEASVPSVFWNQMSKKKSVLALMGKSSSSTAAENAARLIQVPYARGLRPR
jgi:hypothetical protein